MHWKSNHQSLTCRLDLEGQDCLLIKPQTFMNHSGIAVQQVVNFFKIPLEQLIVLHDEIDIPFAQLRIQKNRGAGGHNGLKSINAQLGTQDYCRVKIGVGRPAHPNQNVADFVLQNFNPDEVEKLPVILETVIEALIVILTQGIPQAANKFNERGSLI